MNVPIKSKSIPASRALAAAEGALPIDRKKLGQIVLVLQGGGALGAYQAGVYQALQEVGFEPDWVIGTSTALHHYRHDLLHSAPAIGHDVKQPRHPAPRWQGVAAPAPLRLSRSDTGGATFPDVCEVLAD